MSLTFKLLSLVVRTAAKPIGVCKALSISSVRHLLTVYIQNYIKRQAKEHEGFRRFAIAQAQRVHRIDMRMRLGLLHDAEAQQRMHEREQKAAEEKRRKAEAPTVRTEEEQQKHDEDQAREEKEGKKKKKEEAPKVKIRPLSDARAIELGANFFSEAFIFGVAVALLLLENYRSRSKESSRRDEVADRLGDLEAEVERLKKEHNLPELEALNEKIKMSRDARASWWNPAGWWSRTEPQAGHDADEGVPGEVEGVGTKSIPGNVPIPSSTLQKLAAAAEDGRARSSPQHERIDTVSAARKDR